MIHAFHATGIGMVLNCSTVRQQMAARDLDSHEILQRDTIAGEDVDRVDAGSVLQDVAYANITHGHAATTVERNELIRIKAQRIEEPNGLSNGPVHDRLARRNARVHHVHQDREDTHQSHEHRANAGHQLVHLAHRIGQLAKNRGHDSQESVPNALDGITQTLQRVCNALEHAQKGSKELIDGIQDEARLVLEGLHRTACEVAGDTHADHSRKGHLDGVAPLLNPVLLELIQLRQDPELGRQQKCDHRCRHKDDEVHCHENGLNPVQEITLEGVKNGVTFAD